MINQVYVKAGLMTINLKGIYMEENLLLFNLKLVWELYFSKWFLFFKENELILFKKIEITWKKNKVSKLALNSKKSHTSTE